MMTKQESLLAKKYALAFINIFGNQITDQWYEKIVSMSDMLRQRHDLILRLTLPHVTDEERQKALQLLLPEAIFKTLITLIIMHKRLLLLADILEQSAAEYRKKKHIEHFSITSSHQLSSESLDAIVAFLAVQTDQKITYDYSIDKELIGGIRMQSDNYLWEYSIQKQLQHMRGMLIT